MATKVSGNSYIIPEAEYLDLVQGNWEFRYKSLRHEIFMAFTEWDRHRDQANLGEAIKAISRLSAILSNYPYVG